MTDALTETIDLLTLSPDDDGETWIGVPPAWFGEYVFGGIVVAQAIVAATRDAPVGRRLHSLHAYFLRPVISSERMSFRVGSLRDGRTFTTRPRQRDAVGQAGARHAVLVHLRRRWIRL